jgi:hypothetical protein
MSSCLEGGGGVGCLQMITNVELINFPVGNAYCQYLEEHFQFHTFFSKLNTQRAVAVASWITTYEVLPRRGGLQMITTVKSSNVVIVFAQNNFFLHNL